LYGSAEIVVGFFLLYLFFFPEGYGSLVGGWVGSLGPVWGALLSRGVTLFGGLSASVRGLDNIDALEKWNRVRQGGRREGFRMRRWLNVIGLIFGMIGVVIIFVWGPPQPSFQKVTSSVGRNDQAGKIAEQRRDGCEGGLLSAYVTSRAGLCVHWVRLPAHCRPASIRSSPTLPRWRLDTARTLQGSIGARGSSVPTREIPAGLITGGSPSAGHLR